MRRVGLVALSLLYWTRFSVPDLSPSRIERLPIGDSLADDSGLYWLIPQVMRLGFDVHHAVWAVALAAFAVAVLVQRTPLTTFALIVSAPWYISAGGPYWISAWAVWMALPSGPGLAGAIGLAATPFRGAAGLPALAWAFARSGRWRRRLAAAGILGLGLAAVSSLGSHVLWHSIYIGLGWFPNPWGITYSDWSGIAATSAQYASPEYEAALRSLVFQRIGERPDWFALQLAGKLAQALALAFPWCLGVLFRRELWLPFGMGLLPLVIVVPDGLYATGLLAISVYGAAMTLGFSAERVCHAAPISSGNRSPLPAT